MLIKLKYNTVSPLLIDLLQKLMIAEEFQKFNLVGGTNLSLQLGHRMSVDIDLFSDAKYGTIDFRAIDDYLKRNFEYVDNFEFELIGFGKTYYVGHSKDNCIKLDLFYTDTFIRPFHLIENIRLASLEDISAMKLEVISNSGRKKDFWDIHELLSLFSLEEMIGFYIERYPYGYSREEIIKKATDFKLADDDFNPICLRGKYWEIIKLDLIEEVEKLSL